MEQNLDNLITRAHSERKPWACTQRPMQDSWTLSSQTKIQRLVRARKVSNGTHPCVC